MLRNATKKPRFRAHPLQAKMPVAAIVLSTAPKKNAIPSPTKKALIIPTRISSFWIADCGFGVYGSSALLSSFSPTIP